jgi:mannose-6-phosphate isomerase-like protein (cupin superfamily)
MKNKRVMILNNKVFIRKLDVKNPPLDALGGRILLETGEIAQIINGEKFQYLAYIEFSGNYEIQRGNHYHHSKDEYLYIVKGRMCSCIFSLRILTGH